MLKRDGGIVSSTVSQRDNPEEIFLKEKTARKKSSFAEINMETEPAIIILKGTDVGIPPSARLAYYVSEC